MNPLPVTVVIPVLNEEKNLPSCLAALGDDFTEVVVVDSGSTDRTCEIAIDGGATVLQFNWNGQFPKKRNWTLLHHNFQTPWVFFLDADERVTPEFIEELRGTLQNTPHVGFWISFTNWFMGCPLRHGDAFHKLALFRVGAGAYERFPENGWSTFDMEVHEHPILEGSVGELRARLDHHDDMTSQRYREKHIEYANWEVQRFLWLQHAGDEAWDQLTDRQRFKYRNLDKWWLAPVYFLVSYVLKRGFLDRAAGFHLARLKGHYFNDIRLKIRKEKKVRIQ